MTDKRSESRSWNTEDKGRLVAQYQEILIRQVQAAFDSKEMDEVTYQRFMTEDCLAESKSEICDHFDRLFKELAAYHQERLQQRILKGAELLDSTSKDDPKYPEYMRLYDALVGRLQESQKRGG
ncbi:hypothetical protein SAMN04487895_12746 [Paenibacillus sophorae]|uniref:Uncharacterized protein n=1 Tax=Paenibacillus sophorae TaxID=1333845 RepID=A0A1H8VUM1_9BACL|nr:hypothetical protein [Paenibacillus sophorae]QWU15698.1 hypothetical protein KP014_28445 [Paenibacillus sophorae]SEP18618.1 hypothetical protein SAMN04487895_12746 [Paenibacillus sophorae]